MVNVIKFSYFNQETTILVKNCWKGRNFGFRVFYGYLRFRFWDYRLLMEVCFGNNQNNGFWIRHCLKEKTDE